jgi:hypothetical protein
MTAPAGKTFAGWTANGQNYAVGGSYPVTGDITFTARWIDSSAPSYTASFSFGAGSGTVPDSQTVQSGISIVLPNQGVMTAPAGQVFDGWTAPDGQTYTAGDSYIVTGAVIFTARWKVSSSDPFVGTWTGTDPGGRRAKIVAANGTCRQFLGSGSTETEIIRASYTSTGNTVTVTLTLINKLIFGGTYNWVPYAQLDEEEKEYIGGKDTWTITITGNTLIANGITFTKN